MNAYASLPKPAVVFEHVRKQWGAQIALPDLSLTMAQGKLTTLLGPSGCGKTTTLRLIAGLELPDAGRIAIGGRDVSRVGAQGRDVSMVFQSYALFPHMSVADNVAYGLTVNRIPKNELAHRVAVALERVGLGAYARRMPHALSGGQQQRVAVARALVLEPEVMLFDEPLSNLDARLRAQVRDEIRDLQRELGLTVVYVTHDQEEALAISDDIVVMNKGCVAQQGSPYTLVEQPADAFVAAFIGNANFLDLPVRHLAAGRVTCDLHGEAMALAYAGPTCERIRVAIRPEALHLKAVDGFARRTGLCGDIRRAVWLGRSTQYIVQTTVGDMMVLSHTFDSPLPEGTHVAISVDTRGVAVMGEAA